jgi:hypothetical protein
MHECEAIGKKRRKQAQELRKGSKQIFAAFLNILPLSAPSFYANNDCLLVIAAISTAAMLPTGMIFTMVMVVVVALHIGVICQFSFNKGRNCNIGVAGYATI